MKLAALGVLLAACGGGHSAMPDAAAPPDAALPSIAHFSGNYTETSTSDASATIAHTVAAHDHATLTLMIPTTTRGTSLAGTIVLGTAPTLGLYSSRTVESCRLRAAERGGEGTCLYAAGALEVPQGSCELTVTELADPAIHGSLDLTQFVLGFPSTDCGDSDSETVTVSF